MNTSKKKILVVEDDALIGADLTSTLTGFDYQVLGPVTSGEEVLKNAASLEPDFILMDINLAGKLDGIETAVQLQPICPAPLVFLSALNDEATLQRAKLSNPYGYLIKPFDARELRSTIELTLNRYQSVQQAAERGELLADEDGTTAELAALREEDQGVRNFISDLPVFNGLSPSSIQSIASLFRIRELSAGEFITIEGSDIGEGFIPVSGRIGITKTSDTGKDLVVALLAPGDPFGLLSVLDNVKGSTSARAQIDSKILAVSESEWKRVLENEPLMYKNLCGALTERLNFSYTLSSSLAHARVEGRIISTLLALLPQFGKSSSKNASEGRIYITRKELSELTGTTPETAIRVTKQLERQELLDLTRPGIIKIPDIQKLREALQQ